jgi:hypothetical protein
MSLQKQMEMFERKRLQLDDDVEALKYHLGMLARWQTRKQICACLSWTDRRLRDAAEHSGGQIIFGQLGMRHIRHASMEEAMACKNTLLSQAAKMTNRAMEIDRAHHAWGGKEALA